ncbi:MAG: hypothetical protein HFE84_12575 [Lachnospiraceae bacterium]|nr:hypothetical protein [Lachnospiraceae bacterium]
MNIPTAFPLKRNCLYVLYIAEILILLLNIPAFWRRSSENIAPRLSQWESEYIAYDDGWYVDETIVDTSKAINLIRGPYIPLSKGTYSIHVEYESDQEQSFLAYTGSDGEDAYIKGNTARLSKNQTSVAYKITAAEAVNDFEVIVRYNGAGFLKVKNISIYKNLAGEKRRFAGLFLFFLFLNLYLHLKETIKRNKNLLLTLAGITLLASLPLLIKGISRGHDLPFHFMRIEGLAEELRLGSFPVRLSSLWMDGYGYPISIYYGDLLLYIPALFRLADFSIVSAYKIYVLLINGCTVLLSYICFNKIFKDRNIAVLTCLAYVTASYRMVNIYIRGAVGEYSAMMFLPLVALAVYQIYTADSSDWNCYKESIVPLTLGMSGLIGTHILSVEMVTAVLFLLCMILWKKTFRKNMLRVYIWSIIQTILLNLYFIVPFLDYYRNVQVNINQTVSETIMKIQYEGGYIGDYFAFFKNIFGTAHMENSGERLLLSPGWLIFVCFLSGVLWSNKKASREIKVLTSFSVLMLYMASDLFPWDYLAANYKLGNLLAQVLFPWRYIGLAIIFLTVLLGSVLKRIIGDYSKYRGQIYAAVGILSVYMSCLFVSSYSDGMNLGRLWPTLYYNDRAEMTTSPVIDGAYLKVGTDLNILKNEILQENMETVTLLSRKGTRMELYCKGSGTVEVPMFNYKGYQVKDEFGREYECTDGNNNMLRFSLPDQFKGIVTIDFVEPWYWRLGEAISLISLIAIIVQRRKCRRSQIKILS